MMKYDKDTGDYPVIGDLVETCNFGSMYEDGFFKGTFGGYADTSKLIGTLILSEPSESGSLAISVPVVCLRKIIR